MKTKICTKCKQEKPYSDFYLNNASRDGLTPRCKPCLVEYECARYAKKIGRPIRKKWSKYSDDPKPKKTHRCSGPLEVRKIRQKISRYGLTIEEYNRMLETQNGACKLCLLKTNRLHIDHCHKTGKVRGLLCLNCNVGLGFFSDDVKRMEAAIRYLQS